MPVLFAIVGATGIGKSELSLSLAERFGAEIIGVDSRQIYKGFAIGTAQPSSSDMERVRHHMVNFLDPQQVFSRTIQIKTTSLSVEQDCICSRSC